MTENSGSKRIGFIEQCKGIGILLMVYGHCTTLDWQSRINGATAFKAWICSFHMPLFFILGGCLLAYKNEAFSFPKILTKKALRLLIPGLYFSVPMIAMHVLIKLISGDDCYTYFKENLTALLLVEFYGAMWFLTCYFFTEIIFLLLMKKTITKIQPILISAVFFIGAVCIKSEAHIMVRFSRLMMAICFLGVGYWIYQILLSKLVSRYKQSNYEKNRDGILTAIGLIVVGVMLIATGGFGQSFNGTVSMIDASYGDSAPLFVLYALLETYGFVFLSLGVGKSIPLIEFYGKNSLIVLCSHMFFIEVFWILNAQIFHLPLGSVDARLFALWVILLEAPTIIIINRFFPWLVGQSKKKELDRSTSLS